MDDSNKEIQIYVVSHSEHDIKDIEANDIYVPLFVGRAGKDNLGFLSDDTGDNISDKNSSYCELTGLYWIWKNSTADVIGLAHYRRYFAKWKFGKRLERKDIEEILKDYDIILPKKSNVLFGSVYEDYDHWNHIKDLDLCEDVIKEQCPEYLENYYNVVNGNTLYGFNMFIAKKEIIDGYCEWVFPILFELEKEINAKDYDDYRKRVYGFLTERLFNVWFTHNNLKVRETKVKLIGRMLNFKMFFYKRPLLRWGYVHIYKPYIKK